MARIEHFSLPHRTELFTAAHFAAVLAMNSKDGFTLPDADKLQPQHPNLDTARMILFFKACIFITVKFFIPIIA